jgi:ABC-2 type transport system permease protein
MRAWAAQARTELLLTSRQGEQLLVSLGIPLLLLVFFSLVEVLPVPDGVDDAVDFLVPGVLALAVMSTAMVSLGIGTGFERQYGVLKRLAVTPLGRPRLVAAKIAAVLAVEAAQVVLVLGTGVALGWRPDGADAIVVLPGLLLGTAAFAGIGLLMAGTMRGTLTLALANALYLLLLLLGGMIIPLESLPAALEAVAQLLPAAALAEIMAGALTPDTPISTQAWVVLTLWAVAAPTAAAMLFRWEE